MCVYNKVVVQKSVHCMHSNVGLTLLRYTSVIMQVYTVYNDNGMSG